MKKLIILLACAAAAACTGHSDEYDATGTFETTEIVVSSEAAGRILSFGITEGDSVAAGQPLGAIDSTQLYLQKTALLKNIQSVTSNSPDIAKQIAALKEQLGKQQYEQQRTEKLYADGAATQKQLDDIRSAVAVLRRQIDAQQSTLSNNRTSIGAQSSAMEIQAAQIEDQLAKCRIASPVNGTVLAQYAYAGELAAPGKPLMKVADLSRMRLRAYVTAPRLADVRIGQKVRVYADFGDGKTREYEGAVEWISDKSEFTPKSVTTSDDRANTVYAVKIGVENDGYIKIGLYGGVKF